MSGHRPSQGVLSRYVFSLDHRVIGLQYLLTAMGMALVGGLLALLVRMQIAWPSHEFRAISRVLPQGFDEGIVGSASTCASLLT